MSKLLKHLGLGGKKAPPQPPKPDYSALKSSSLDSSLARSPTSEKSAAGMSTTSSQISGFEVGQLQGSPGHREKGFGGARPKDTGGGGVSPHGLQTRPSIQSFGVGEEGEAPASVENGGSPGATAGPSATPVRKKVMFLLTPPIYIDLRLQIFFPPGILLSCHFYLHKIRGGGEKKKPVGAFHPCNTAAGFPQDVLR